MASFSIVEKIPNVQPNQSWHTDNDATDGFSVGSTHYEFVETYCIIRLKGDAEAETAEAAARSTHHCEDLTDKSHGIPIDEFDGYVLKNEVKQIAVNDTTGDVYVTMDTGKIWYTKLLAK